MKLQLVPTMAKVFTLLLANTNQSNRIDDTYSIASPLMLIFSSSLEKVWLPEGTLRCSLQLPKSIFSSPLYHTLFPCILAFLLQYKQ